MSSCLQIHQSFISRIPWGNEADCYFFFIVSGTTIETEISCCKLWRKLMKMVNTFVLVLFLLMHYSEVKTTNIPENLRHNIRPPVTDILQPWSYFMHTSTGCRLQPVDVTNLLSVVKNLGSKISLHSKFSKNSIVITAGAYNYRAALYNWIHHMEANLFQNYVVLCFDRIICDLVGPVHGVLMSNSLNYTVSDVRHVSNASDTRKITPGMKSAASKARTHLNAKQRRSKASGRTLVPIGSEFKVVISGEDFCATI